MIYSEDKTKIIENPDYSKGYLKDDILIVHHDEIPGVEGKKEKGHYEVIAEYDNGGKDIQWIIDEEGVAPVAKVEAWDEKVPIRVFIEYPQEYLILQEKENELLKIKDELSATDYKTLKYVEGYYTDEEYAEIKEYREELRAKIRKLTEEIEKNKSRLT